jgi:hypothetical protein
VDFRFTPDELEVHRYARTSARAHLPLSRLADPATDAAAWAAFAADGWTQACLDGPVDLPLLAGLAREVGAVAGGEAFVHNGWLLPRLVGCAAGPERGEWLVELRARPGFLVGPDGAAVDAGSGVVRAVRAVRAGFDDYRLDGRRLGRLGSPAGVDALGGLSTQLGRAVPGEPEAGIDLDLDDAGLSELWAGAAVLRAAGLVGLAAEILAATVTHVGSREQFGQVIGRFQALKHLCADVHAQIEVAWLAVLHAAVAPHDPLAVDAAVQAAASASLDAARVGAQLHGGMGFTWESDLHWLLKAALDGQLTGGSAGAAAQRIGRALVERA